MWTEYSTLQYFDTFEICKTVINTSIDIWTVEVEMLNIRAYFFYVYKSVIMSRDSNASIVAYVCATHQLGSVHFTLLL